MLLSVIYTLSALLLGAQARPKSYAVWAADSAIARGQGNGLASDGDTTVSYEHGELQWGLRMLYDVTGNQSYYDYILAAANRIVDSSGKIIGSDYSLSDYSQDPVRTGPTFAYLYEKTGAAKWKTAMDTFHTQLMGQPRTAEGQFWHKLRYFNQGWLDGIYMGEIFYAIYTNKFQPTNKTAYADIVHQFELMYANTLQEEGAANYTGLLYHGYDYSHTAVWASPDRGHSPEIWDRAMGWYMMALVDMIELWPQAGDTSVFLSQLRTLAPRVIGAADPASGVWWLVMTQPGRQGNYFESSAAVMFVYAILKGVRLGYLHDGDGSLVAGAIKAYAYIVDNWVVENSDGTMNWLNTVHVGSLDGNGTFEYYISVSTTLNDLKGLAAFLLASLEYEKL